MRERQTVVWNRESIYMQDVPSTKLLDAPLLIQDAPPDVTCILRYTVGAIDHLAS